MLSSTSPGVLAAAVSHGPRKSFDGEMLSELIATASASLDSDRATAKDCIQRAADLLQVLRQERLPAQSSSTFVRGGLATWQQKHVAAYVEANISANIRATDLARVARLSNSHFCRAFRKSFDERPMAYVLKQRIRRGQELMRKSQASPCEIWRAGPTHSTATRAPGDGEPRRDVPILVHGGERRPASHHCRR
jgi:AraC family transcriptional regulator